MDWSDQPANVPASWSPEPSPAAEPAEPAEVTGSPVLGGARRLIATTVLAIGLLGVGGAAVVFAADPSATPAPSAGTQTTPGSGGSTAPGTPGARPNGGGHAAGDCPNMGGSGSGSGSNGSSVPSTNGWGSPSASNL